jgi:hypothetical protein
LDERHRLVDMCNELWLVMMECIELNIFTGRLGHHLMIIFGDKNQKRWTIPIAVLFLLTLSYPTYDVNTPDTSK